MGMIAPVGALVRITYDPNPGDVVHAGEYLLTLTGRAYRVCSVRPMRSKLRPGRLHLTCLVAHRADGDRVHPLVWNPRSRSR